MNTQKKITAKDVIAQQLFDNTTSQFPSSLITEILERLQDTREYSSMSTTSFNHETSSMLEACNVDKESFHKKLEDLKNYHISDKSTKLSQVVEQMEKTFSIREACFFAISNMSKMVEMETASELIKVLKGFKE